MWYAARDKELTVVMADEYHSQTQAPWSIEQQLWQANEHVNEGGQYVRHLHPHTAGNPPDGTTHSLETLEFNNTVQDKECEYSGNLQITYACTNCSLIVHGWSNIVQSAEAEAEMTRWRSKWAIGQQAVTLEGYEERNMWDHQEKPPNIIGTYKHL
jgi:hypothetical protein